MLAKLIKHYYTDGFSFICQKTKTFFKDRWVQSLVEFGPNEFFVNIVESPGLYGIHELNITDNSTDDNV